jgi:hypothetical protein
MARPFGCPLASTPSVRSAWLGQQIWCGLRTTHLRHYGVKS